MTRTSKVSAYIFLTLLSVSTLGQSMRVVSSSATGKQLYLPDTVWNVPGRNNYNDSLSEFSFNRMHATDNIAAFWSKEFGSNPNLNADIKQQFDIQLP